MELEDQKKYQIRIATPRDALPIVDLALRVKGVLHFPPAQLEWLLKQENSDFRTLLCFEASGNIEIKGFLIAKKKLHQIEILEIYSESGHARKIYGSMLDSLGEFAKKELLEGITQLTPGGEGDLQESFLDQGFYRAKIIDGYYIDGKSAELWVKQIQPVKTT